MRPDIKESLTERAQIHGDSVGLSEIVMNSFSLQFNETLQLSATDMAFAVSSLLEDPTSAHREEEQDNENMDPNAASA